MSGDDPQHPEIEVGGIWGATFPRGRITCFSGPSPCSLNAQHVPLPSVRIRMTIHIPPGCGLGSSATAVVGGLVAANEWLRPQG